MIPGIGLQMGPNDVFKSHDSPFLKALAVFPKLSKVRIIFEQSSPFDVPSEEQAAIRAQISSALSASVTDLKVEFIVCSLPCSCVQLLQ